MNRYLVSGTQLDCIKNKIKDQELLAILSHIEKSQHIGFSYNLLSDDISRLRANRITSQVKA